MLYVEPKVMMIYPTIFVTPFCVHLGLN